MKLIKKQIYSPLYLKLLRLESVEKMLNVNFVFENYNPSTIKSVMVNQGHICLKK
jgi:hypothetical protein